MASLINKKEIPKGWKLEKLGALYDVTSSKRVFQNEWTTSGVPFYRAREIVKLHENGYVDNELFISEEMYQTYKKKYGVPKENDLLVTGVGTVGILHRVKDKNPFYFKDGNIIWFKDKGKVSSEYIDQLFKTPFIKKQIFGGNPITTVATYTIDAAKKTHALLPPKDEQLRIIGVLKTWDQAIEKLKRKIEIKKAVKKGLVQELVTGKNRLPGFKDSWHKDELGNLLDYEQPVAYLVRDVDYKEFGTPVLTAGKTFILGYTDEDFGVYNKGKVIVFDDFTTASKFVDFDFKVKSSAIKLLTPKNDKSNLKFLYERMQLIHTDIKEHKRRYISDYQYIPVEVPSKTEQDAIAKVFTIADKEIVMLEKRIRILRDQKKYLLSNLMTGKIRTPETLSTPK